jgi:superfamily II DNA or RNA helicase
MIARRRQPALIVVHTKDLARQWMQRIETFLDIPAEQIGMIGGGKKTIGERVTVAMVQSLYKCAEDVSHQIGHLVVDECHRAPSRTFTEAVTDFDARYMLGLSATPWRRDNLSRLIFWHLGDVHHQVDQQKLIESGHVLPAEVIFRETGFRPYFDPVQEYSKMLAELTANDERNRMIAADVARVAANGQGVCLVLSDRKKHCETLQSLLRFKYKLAAELLTGDLSSAQRAEVIDRLNAGRIKVLVATGQLIGEGFDCRDLTTLFMATPVRFSGRVIQYLGRILRPAPGKEQALVYDYVDIHVEPLVKAARARKQIYGKIE